MLLGELTKIDEATISNHHEAHGNNKQRYRPDYRQVHRREYTSMYPLSKDTTLICMFVDLDCEIGVYYVPCGEPLFRKYPKRRLEDSFVNIHTGCPISIVGRIVDINSLPIDARVAYLYLSSIRLSLGGVLGYMGRCSSNITAEIYDVEAHGSTRVKKLARDEEYVMEGVLPDLIAKHRISRSAILSTGAARMASKIVCSFRGSLGNILEELFSHMGASPPVLPPTPRQPRFRSKIRPYPGPTEAPPLAVPTPLVDMNLTIPDWTQTPNPAPAPSFAVSSHSQFLSIGPDTSPEVATSSEIESDVVEHELPGREPEDDEEPYEDDVEDEY